MGLGSQLNAFSNLFLVAFGALLLITIRRGRLRRLAAALTLIPAASLVGLDALGTLACGGAMALTFGLVRDERARQRMRVTVTLDPMLNARTPASAPSSTASALASSD
jgi:hypothetical protein